MFYRFDFNKDIKWKLYGNYTHGTSRHFPLLLLFSLLPDTRSFMQPPDNRTNEHILKNVFLPKKK